MHLFSLVDLDLNSKHSELGDHETAFLGSFCLFELGGLPSVDLSIPCILMGTLTAGQATWRHSFLPRLLDLESERLS